MHLRRTLPISVSLDYPRDSSDHHRTSTTSSTFTLMESPYLSTLHTLSIRHALKQELKSPDSATMRDSPWQVTAECAWSRLRAHQSPLQPAQPKSGQISRSSPNQKGQGLPEVVSWNSSWPIILWIAQFVIKEENAISKIFLKSTDMRKADSENTREQLRIRTSAHSSRLR